MILRTLLACVLAAATAVMIPTAASGQQPAATTPPPAAIAAPPEPTSSFYVLGRDDSIEVGLLGGGGFGGRARVQADGTIQLPLIGKIQAADRTTSELADAIRKALQAGGFYADPVVTIEVVGYASRYVTVLGAFGAPGLVPMNRPYRLSEILARVGGVRDGAADYIVVRSDTGEEKRFMIRDLSVGNNEQDPYVAAGDKIYAPMAETFYIYGQINAPGVYPIQSGMTVRMALARASGLTQQGSDKKIDVTRGGKKMKLKLDDKVEGGDVLVIGERMF